VTQIITGENEKRGTKIFTSPDFLHGPVERNLAMRKYNSEKETTGDE